MKKGSQPTLRPKHLSELREALKSMTGMVLRDDLIRRILTDLPDVRKEVAVHGGDLDTDVREKFLEHLAETIVGRGWPSNAEGRDAYQKFLSELAKKGKKHGLTFVKPDPLEVQARAADDLPGSMVLEIAGKLNHGNKEKVWQIADRLGPRTQTGLILDVKEVTSIDLSALASMVLMSRKLNISGGTLVLVRLSPSARELVDLLRDRFGDDALPSTFSTEKEAVAFLRRRRTTSTKHTAAKRAAG